MYFSAFDPHLIFTKSIDFAAFFEAFFSRLLNLKSRDTDLSALRLPAGNPRFSLSSFIDWFYAKAAHLADAPPGVDPGPPKSPFYSISQDRLKPPAALPP